jgi:hypothetical protein
VDFGVRIRPLNPANDRTTSLLPVASRLALAVLCCTFAIPAISQTDCSDGNAPLDMTPPKGTSVEELIRKLSEQENKARDAREHYTFTQDVLVQTLDGKTADGQFHEITQVSYGEKGKRIENIKFAEQSTLRGVQLTAEDADDVRFFMPWMLTTDQVAQYKLTYAGQQHVDDLDTYVLHVEPKTEEKNKRYFQGRIWVDNRDLQIVKLCGKSVPDVLKVKKKQAMDVRPMFVGYRQYVDGNWFPAYAKVDDTLHFNTDSIHIRQIVKFSEYKRTGTTEAAPKQ